MSHLADIMETTDGPDGLAALAPVANGKVASPSRYSQIQERGDVIQARLSSNTYTRPESFAREELRQRDQSAIEYSKGELNQGDTLVFIKYPNDVKVIDPYGFEMKTVHRVHSKNLLKTGSPVFKKMLEPLFQGRFRRRLGYAGSQPKLLPVGIEYVLDLTPPDEGDDALELLADLTCSRGVLAWFTAVKRLFVAATLAGGMDEIQVPQETNSGSASPNETPFNLGAAKTTVEDPFDQDSWVNRNEFANDLTGSDTDAALEQALKESREEAERLEIETSRKVDEKFVEDNIGTVIHDYDPIRHRAGIERLLQLIEGKSCRLDSAPKVWTLVMLAKYFKCTSTVADYVTTWLFAEPNCRFIEILPEAALRIGYALETPALTRQAFAILVSEEAIRVGSPLYFKSLLSDTEKAKLYGNDVSRFGRVREHILDEDMVNTIQHAGRAFFARIESIMKNLLDPDLPWLQGLPEYQKLLRLERFMKEFPGPVSNDQVSAQSIISHFKNHLINYVRGRVYSCLVQPLTVLQAKQADEHRDAEKWSARPDQTFGFLYNDLADYERFMCSYLWANFRDQDWGIHNFKNLFINHKNPHGPVKKELKYDLVKAHNIKITIMPELEEARNDFNRAVIKAIQKRNYNDGYLPRHSYISRADPSQEVPVSGEVDDQFEAFGKGKLYKAILEIQDLFPTAPADERIPFDSPYFCLAHFFKQVAEHVHDIARSLLSRGECDFAELVDSLTCLTDNEWKFLPLWAGGMDDGTGGVFEETIPFAERGGPAGPGPSYNTGSTLNSWAGSEVGPDDSFSVVDSATEGINSSIQVDDGHNSHIDRRTVISEEDFPADAETLGVKSMTSDGTLTPTTEIADIEMEDAVMEDYEDVFNAEDDEEDLNLYDE